MNFERPQVNGSDVEQKERVHISHVKKWLYSLTPEGQVARCCNRTETMFSEDKQLYFWGKVRKRLALS